MVHDVLFFEAAYTELREAVSTIIKKYPEIDVCAIVPVWKVPSQVIPTAVIAEKQEGAASNPVVLLELCTQFVNASSALQLGVIKSIHDTTIQK